MKFKTLENKEVVVSTKRGDYPLRSEAKSKSRGQFHLGKVLLEIYGSNAIILEEFPIPESRLSVDFFLPHIGLAFEFQGIQHDKFNAFFHQTKKDFAKQKERDGRTRRWCDMNDITLVEIRDMEITAQELQNSILESYDG
jgi:hypothetical protein